MIYGIMRSVGSRSHFSCEMAKPSTNEPSSAIPNMKNMEQLRDRLYSIHEQMRSVAKQFRHGSLHPPLLCYALDDRFLDGDTYGKLQQNRKDFILSSGQIRQCYYAVMLYLVRAFYEKSDGRDWKQAADIQRQKDVDEIRKLIVRRDMPWHDDCDEETVSVMEWLKTQCPILKAERGGDSSVVIDVNTAFHKLLVERNVNLLSNGRSWMTLAHMTKDELDKLKQDVNLQTRNLKQDFEKVRLRRIESVLRKNPKYAVALWEHSRFEWMLALEAITSSQDEIPVKVYETWPWLKAIAALADQNKKTVLRAQWMLYRDGNGHRLYLSLDKADRLADCKLRISQGSLEHEFDMPSSELGYEAVELWKRGFSPMSAEELRLELLTEGGTHLGCSLPTITSCGGCMVFRNLYPKLQTAELPMIAPRTLVQTPDLKLAVLHGGKGNPIISLALHREGEEKALACVSLDRNEKLVGSDCYCSTLEIRDFKTQSPLHRARIHSVNIQGSNAVLFEALWKPEIELHPLPNPNIWVKDEGSVKVIEENRGEGLDVVYLKADGVDSVHLPEGVVRLPDAPPGEIFEPEEGCCLESLRLPHLKLLPVSVGRSEGTKELRESLRQCITKATLLYLPRNWRENAVEPPDEDTWSVAKNLEEHRLVTPEDGSASLCVCTPIKHVVWRWQQGDTPCNVNTALHTAAGWESWKLELVKPGGSKVYLHLGANGEGKALDTYALSCASSDGIKAGTLLSRLFPGLRPTQEFEFFISTSPDGRDKKALLSGSVRRSKEFYYDKDQEGSIRLYLCMLPADRECCTLCILHESAMFNPNVISEVRKLDCSALNWSEDHSCEVNTLFDSRDPNGFYRIRIEDSRVSTNEGILCLPEQFKLLQDAPDIAWYEKGSDNLGLPKDKAKRIGANPSIQPKLFDRMRKGKYVTGEEIDKLVKLLQDPESKPRDAYPLNPLFSSEQILQKLREDAASYKPTYM